MMAALTPRKQQILRCIVKYVEERGYPPSIREIGEEVGLSSPSSVKFQLDWLVREGYLSRDGMKGRAIKVESAQPASETA